MLNRRDDNFHTPFDFKEKLYTNWYRHLSLPSRIIYNVAMAVAITASLTVLANNAALQFFKSGVGTDLLAQVSRPIALIAVIGMTAAALLVIAICTFFLYHTTCNHIAEQTHNDPIGVGPPPTYTPVA